MEILWRSCCRDISLNIRAWGRWHQGLVTSQGTSKDSRAGTGLQELLSHQVWEWRLSQGNAHPSSQGSSHGKAHMGYLQEKLMSEGKINGLKVKRKWWQLPKHHPTGDQGERDAPAQERAQRTWTSQNMISKHDLKKWSQNVIFSKWDLLKRWSSQNMIFSKYSLLKTWS